MMSSISRRPSRRRARVDVTVVVRWSFSTYARVSAATAEKHRVLRSTPRVHPSRFSFMTTVDFASSPDIPMTSAFLSRAASKMVLIGCLIPG